MRSLDGATVAITGAGSGIGRAIALRAASHGATLALADVDEVGLLQTAELAQPWPDREVLTEKLDVRDRDAVGAWADSLQGRLRRVNVLVNNAGVALHGEFTEVDHPQLERVMDVNFWGVVHACQAFLPHLIASGNGHLVNVSSLFGLMGMPGQTAYNASKFAVRGLTEALRQEMLVAGHPVEVSCVHPGGVRTAIARNAETTASHDPGAVADFFDRRLARTSPERAAEVIVDGILANRPRILVGADARLLDAWVRVVGASYQRTVARVAARVMPRRA
jgi:NAD(P)-dependent dehydrogenase (short-subunit alcohol dehydrogenase family)